MDRVLIVDGPNLLMRAIYAADGSGMHVPGTTVSTGPLLIFINTLSRYVRDLTPDRVAVCWDSGPSLRRLALLASYKANRPQRDPEAQDHKDSHFALAKEFCSVAGVHHVIRSGEEADDLVGAYCRAHPHDEVVILSNDKDFFQLLTHNVTLIRPSGAGGAGSLAERWNGARVLKDIGCPASSYAAVLALAGDVSDNVPGVPRVGVKTAVRLLKDVGWRLTELEAHPKIAQHWDQVLINRQLVDLTDSPVQVLPAPRFRPVRHADLGWDDLITFLRRYALRTIETRVVREALWKEQHTRS